MKDNCSKCWIFALLLVFFLHEFTWKPAVLIFEKMQLAFPKLLLLRKLGSSLFCESNVNKVEKHVCTMRCHYEIINISCELSTWNITVNWLGRHRGSKIYSSAEDNKYRDKKTSKQKKRIKEKIRTTVITNEIKNL